VFRTAVFLRAGLEAPDVGACCRGAVCPRLRGCWLRPWKCSTLLRRNNLFVALLPIVRQIISTFCELELGVRV